MSHYEQLEKCPKCGCTHIAVEVRTWVYFRDGSPSEFDGEDAQYAEPIAGGDCICRDCQHTWAYK